MYPLNAFKQLLKIKFIVDVTVAPFNSKELNKNLNINWLKKSINRKLMILIIKSKYCMSN